MKYLLPLLCCAAVFFGGRQFRVMREASASADGSAASAAAKSHGSLRGLARQAERLAGRNFTSAAVLKRLYLDGTLSPEEAQLAIRQATENDPEGVWRWITGDDFSAYEREGMCFSVLPVWFAKDPAKALAALSGIPAPLASSMASSLIGQLGGADEELVEAVRGHLPELVSLLGGEDHQLTPPPRTADNAELLLSLADDCSRDLLLGRFAVAWLAEDPVAGMAFLQRLPEGLRTPTLEGFAEKAFADRDMPDKVKARKFAMDWLLKEAPVSARTRLGPRLALAMAEDDPAAALKWAGANLEAKALADTTTNIVERAVEKNPQAARSLVESLPAGPRRELAACKVAEEGLSKDAAAAITWWLGQAHGDASERREMPAGMEIMRLGRTWYERDPASFRDWLADADAPKLPELLMQSGLQSMMKDREATFEWIGSLPQASRAPVVKLAYQHLAGQSPEAAAAAYEARPDLATGDSARIIAITWYGRDQQKAIGWVAELPWGGAREAALAGLRKMAESQVQRGGSIPEELKELLR